MRTPLRVLLVEDSPDDAELILLTLENGGVEADPLRVETREALVAALTARDWDVVLSDYNLPQLNGPEALRLVRGAGLDIPFIMVSGTIGEDVAVQVLKAGADDYLLKSSLKRLVSAVNHELRNAAERRSRREAEGRERLAREVLEALNRPDGAPDTIRDILHLVKRHTGVEAVGIRLRDGDDFPYYETNGFPEDFVDAERSLCARDSAGEIVRDELGNPALECMCGNILCGRFDPSLPFFTAGGSFWTNSTIELPASTTEAGRLARTRNRCNGEGYESVALVPLRSSGEAIGLLQLNDHRRDRFTPDMVAFLESLGSSIGIALARKRTEESLAYLNRVLRAIRNVNQLIVRERNPQVLIQEACRLLVQHRGYSSVLVILTDQTGAPRAWAEAGLGEAFRPLAESLQQGRLPPCCSGANQQDRAFLVTERARTCISCPAAAHLPSNHAMCMRLKHGGRTYGYLTVSVDHPLGVDDEERSLFAEVAGDVAYALHGIEQSEAIRRSEDERDQAEAALRQAQKMEAVGRLAGGVAHDFNNLLQALLGAVHGLRDELAGRPEAVARVTEVEELVERGSQLTRQLLLFSRRERARPETLDLNQVVERMRSLLGRLLKADIALAVELAPVPLVLEADRGQLEQVIANLAVNAADAMPAGGRLTLRTSTRAGGLVSLEVEDTGCGIPEQVLPHIFEPFFTTKERGKGTGLGLSVVHGIVTQHGGTVEGRSRQGLGTVLTILLPASDQAATADALSAPTVVVAGQGERILVVEDDPGVRLGVSRMLKVSGYQVLAVGSAADALALEGDAAFDLLISDVVLGDGSGRELARTLAGRWPGMAVVLMSGYAEEDLGGPTEGVRFLPKPFQASALLAEVRAALSARFDRKT